VLTEQQERHMKVDRRYEFEGPVRFAVWDDMVAVANESDKLVKFFDVSQLLSEGSETTLDHLVPKHIYKNWKKVTTIHPMNFEAKDDKDSKRKIKGVLIADKVGEVYFLNLDNLEKLPKDPETIPGKNEAPESYDYVAKLVYGHQQTCTFLNTSSCGRFLISVDTLNKVIVNNFPNMFNLQSVSTEQQSEIKDCIQV